jgi:hypothetical protein
MSEIAIYHQLSVITAMPFAYMKRPRWWLYIGWYYANEEEARPWNYWGFWWALPP